MDGVAQQCDRERMNLLHLASAIAPKESDEPSFAASLITLLIPLLPIGAMLVFIMRFVRRSDDARKIWLEHMRRMEEKTDRLIALLEAATPPSKESTPSASSSIP
jgi:hypothetical protein